MKLRNVLIAVKDIEKSKRFYHDLFGLDVVLDHDGNVIMTEGLVLQDAKIWSEFLGREILPQNNSSELYFEEKNIEGLEPGGKFEFTLTPAEGYGEVDPARIIDLPLDAFEVNGTVQESLLVPGATIPLMNSLGGIVPGKVVEIHQAVFQCGKQAVRPHAGGFIDIDIHVVHRHA